MIVPTASDTAHRPDQQEAGQLRPIDRQFQRFLYEHFGADEHTALAGGIASALLEDGHTCLFLDAHAGEVWGDGKGRTFQLPPPDEWRAALTASNAVAGPGEKKPLILDGHRLYLYRYFNYEVKTAARLRAMIPRSGVEVPDAVLTLAREFFNEKSDLSASGGQIQAAGALLPFFSKLSIIAGGPGTGKTTVLAKLLALLCADAIECGRPLPVFKLAAPTGKAAQRLATSIQEFSTSASAGRNEAGRSIDQRIITHLSASIPSTLHRLLGLSAGSPKPRRDSFSPIEADVVVVDEASMMDITLFARLVDALAPDARLILLGDRSQLASVEAGCILADICEAFTPNLFTAEFAAVVNSALAGSVNHISASPDDGFLSPVVELKHSYRFEGNKPIGVVSTAVNAGVEDDVLLTLDAAGDGAEYCVLARYPGRDAMSKRALEEFRPLLESRTPEEALDHLEDYVILTALNEGMFGRVGINQQILRSLGAIPRVRPVKITENSLQHRLFNGDMGVIMRIEGEHGTEIERAWFPFVPERNSLPAGHEKGKPRCFLVGALPAYVDAFAITIHNSQGSEFDAVAIVLPESDTPLLTRELLYTAITRARTRATIYGAEEIVRNAVGRRIVRHSGMAERLKQPL